jgi:hypothetical protein
MVVNPCDRLDEYGEVPTQVVHDEEESGDGNRPVKVKLDFIL